jgi:hypothetical protein
LGGHGEKRHWTAIMGCQDKWAIQISCFEDGESVPDPLLEWKWMTAR